MKLLAYILTGAAILVGADVFVMSTDSTTDAVDTSARLEEPISLTGGSGIPTPPPDAY